MKKAFCVLCVILSLLAFMGASVWEGAAEFTSELPANGHFIATNSFPVNTVVDVTNLENGRIARLIVSARLDSSGFLALLSKDAADTLGIGINDNSMSRIRMSQNEDPLALSRFLSETGITGFEGAPETDSISLRSESSYDYTLVSSEPRPPEKRSENRLPLLGSAAVPLNGSESFRTVSESKIASYMIGDMEKGKYYVQIAAYSKAETAESAISKIDKSLPVAVMNVGSGEKPIYRLLIGPVNQGESGAILQRFMADYEDAFVRQGI